MVATIRWARPEQLRAPRMLASSHGGDHDQVLPFTPVRHYRLPLGSRALNSLAQHLHHSEDLSRPLLHARKQPRAPSHRSQYVLSVVRALGLMHP